MDKHIAVCIKQVPAVQDIQTDSGRGTLIREGRPARINPNDLHALEAALHLRERFGARVTALCMGPKSARDVLQTAYEMGVDHAVLLSDTRFSGADTFATSYTLARGLGVLGAFDIVLCGRQSSDGDTGQVGPSLAEHMGWPHVFNAVSVEGFDNGSLCATQRMGDQRISLRVPLPCVVVTAQDAFPPRLPSLRGKLAAKKKEVRVLALDDIAPNEAQCFGLDGSPTRVQRIYAAPRPQRQQPVSGDADGLAALLLDSLRL